MFVKPAAGLKIRDPELGDYLPPEGREVNDQPYWHRRIRDQDVTATVAAPAPAESTEDAK